MVSEAAENNMDNRMKDLLPEKFFHTLHFFHICWMCSAKNFKI